MGVFGQNGHFWPKLPILVKNGQNGHFWSFWPKNGQNGHFWPFTEKMTVFWVKKVGIWRYFGPKRWEYDGLFGQKWPKKVGIWRSFWVIFGHFTGKMTVFGPKRGIFGPFLGVFWPKKVGIWRSFYPESRCTHRLRPKNPLFLGPKMDPHFRAKLFTKYPPFLGLIWGG